jgi:2-oxoglutarate dehydrogenase E1 component
MNKHSYLSQLDPNMIDELYQQYLKDSESVEPGWRKFFDGYEFSKMVFPASEEGSKLFQKELNVLNLINGYRERGHLFTKTNPVRTRRKYTPEPELAYFGLSEDDLDTVFQAGNELGLGPASLRNIREHLEATYCASVGAEYMYVRHPERLKWLQQRMECCRNKMKLSPDERKHILYKLNQAVGFEHFIQKKYPGQKRFSLEGAESLIPALDAIIEKGAELGIEEFVIGMPHRGRLNVLANILNKSYYDIFNEFDGSVYEDELLLGDVKYHLGYSSDFIASTGRPVKLNLAPNPSHLEAVNTVVQGITRAKIDHKYKGNSKKIAPVLIHGDAAIAGQGVVYEGLQMMLLKGYSCGGTLHIVINNQVGFTTNYLDARSSTYCTDIAKTTLSPAFHVNGDDVEALIYTIKLALEYREKFGRDVFIDILCYRRYGHNESDEPRFTQPILYKIIEKHPNPRDIYKKQLMDQALIEADTIKEMEEQFDNYLQQQFDEAKLTHITRITPFLEDNWKNISKDGARDFEQACNTGMDKEKLFFLASKINAIPNDIKLFRKTEKLLQQRQAMMEKSSLDWAMAELLAYASLLEEGYNIRFSGQDVERGTFSHRHAVLTIEDSEEKYIPLKHISHNQARFDIYNSPLSEYGVLGFDYGYAMVDPNNLVIWEAQFGDFSNGAQIIFDQFISAAEDKWKIKNGIVVLLPHGFEGQGPEHSSARMERFLTLCAGFQMQVLNCTTPANFFHALRRQMIRNIRIPMIVFTPKSLLRHPQCVSSLEDLSGGSFQEIIDDLYVEASDVQKIIFCSGKIYYDLAAERQKLKRKDIAIVRLEQISPLPRKKLHAIIARYQNAKRYEWVQEEPENMGAWPFISWNFREVPLEVVARPASGSPATGLSKLHFLRQEKIISKALDKCTCDLAKTYCGLECAQDLAF